MFVLVHHSEIILKGKNRGFFENILVRNIQNHFGEIKIKKDMGRILCTVDDKTDINEFKKIFGIKDFAKVEIVDRNKLFEKVEEILKGLSVKTLSPEVRRSDKSFPLTSIEVSKKIGEIANKLGIKIDFKNAEKKLNVQITEKNVYVFPERQQAYGGLPVGTSGKVLCLLSGGIDSPVAAWMAMKRGCHVDFLHIHTYRENKEVLGTKIEALAKKLNEYQGNSKLYLVPYHNYQFESLSSNERIDLVLFKNFILRLAQEVVQKENYGAIITGDSIGQVASQTMQNLQSTSYGINSLVLRPVICFNKDEIIDLAQEIGVYEESIKEYKDCCSIIAKRPLTRASTEQVKKGNEEIDMNRIVAESMKSLEEVKI